MADEIDLASAFIDAQVSHALNKIRRQTSSLDTKGSDFCLNCGDEMLADRKKLGYELCVPCASESERKKSLYAG